MRHSTVPLFVATGLILLASTLARGQASEDQLRTTLETQRSGDTAAARAQVRIAQLAEQTAEALGEYRLTTQQLDRVKIYNDHLQRLVNDQEEEKTSIQRQLDDFERTEKGIIPFMQEMVDSLDQFIELDIPFNLDERTERVQRLRDSMDRADMTISEKYRQIMEAYGIETDFGRTMEAYSGKLDLGSGQEREVDFLRIGRLVLAYQTLDREETGYWNTNDRSWNKLPEEYRSYVQDGLKIARKQAAPNMLRLPVPAPEEAR